MATPNINDFDRSKLYFKVTNATENHNGLQYHDGLVEDIVPFNDNPEERCVPGGIYFTDERHIYAFFDYGCYVRPITIPEDAKVIHDHYNDMYRANKVFMHPRMTLREFFEKYFNKETFNYNYYSWVISKYFPEKFDPDKFNWDGISWAVAKYCPDKLDPERFNWEEFSWAVAEYCPDKLDPERFNWEEEIETVAKYCPEKLSLKPQHV